MKKIAILLVLLLVLSCLAACGADKPEETASGRRESASREKREEAAPPAEPDPAPETEPAGETELPASCTYTVLAADKDGAPVAGVMVNFCTDESCTTVTTDENGTAVFTGEPYSYHVMVIKAPKGFRVEGEKEFYTELCDQSFSLLIAEAEG